MVKFYSPSKATAEKKITVTICVERLDHFGQGIGFYHGQTVFIPQALPGEEVSVQLTPSKKRFTTATLKQVILPSPQRETPPCRYFSHCGGCQLQHMPIEMQHSVKKQHLMNQLSCAGVTTLTEDQVSVIADRSYGYRRRTRIALFYKAQHKKLYFGFRKAQQREIIDIESCPVLTPRIEVLLPHLKETLQSLQGVADLGHLEMMDVDSGVIVILRTVRALNQTDREQLRALAQKEQFSLYLHHEVMERLVGEGPLYYMIDGLRLSFSPSDFIQVNAAINQKMVAAVHTLLQLKKEDRLLDLFCGMGNISLPLAKKAGVVVGVEGVDAQVEKARYNSQENSAQLCASPEFYQADLSQLQGDEAWWSSDFDIVVLDPSRQGADAVMNHIVQKSPQKVIYISCNPATLGRDCRILLQSDYQLEHAAVLDMFPNTQHSEALLLFIRKGV